MWYDDNGQKLTTVCHIFEPLKDMSPCKQGESNPMNRLDRALGILLYLRKGGAVAASDLAAHFEVSIRTIYRDIEALSELGIPVYAELGRTGGFRLVEGYFLPPIMLTNGEATSLLLGLTLLRRLRVTPFPGEMETAEHKLLAALPDALRDLLACAPQWIGFEELPVDTFHWGPHDSSGPAPAILSVEARAQESRVVNTFLQAIFAGQQLHLHYRSPYRSEASSYTALPCGLLWDRNWWYLVGKQVEQTEELWLWRADRVLAITPQGKTRAPRAPFDVSHLLGRTWLKEAMNQWISEAPVKIRMSAAQAARLQSDWYYAQARYASLPSGQVLMTIGEDKAEFVLDLVRWLGPGAELLEPVAWRAQLQAELTTMLGCYRADS
jgi:predicted DNA-binding transcriptional regulator YafY